MLFPQFPSENILPCNGAAIYYEAVFSAAESGFYYNQFLTEIAWKNDEVVIYGKKIVTHRKMAWYADDDLSYTYSGIERRAMPFTKNLCGVKKIVENITGATYNSCLLNLYHNGTEGMGWHSDDEKMLKNSAAIASVSFGAARRFLFRHKKTREIISLTLQSGSVLLMQNEIQQHWQHSLPKTTTVPTPRINLTFRKIIK